MTLVYVNLVFVDASLCIMLEISRVESIVFLFPRMFFWIGLMWCLVILVLNRFSFIIYGYLGTE
ncbi:hypothetical protein HanIR_Chr13g0658721 [Helianthus annuus]|nr:hypothetical protein HanIR_Chr13g0658721 [Helianthus annuus]